MCQLISSIQSKNGFVSEALCETKKYDLVDQRYQRTKTNARYELRQWILDNIRLSSIELSSSRDSRKYKPTTTCLGKMAARSEIENIAAGANYPSECGQANSDVPVASSHNLSNDPGPVRKEESSSKASPRRRSSRDRNVRRLLSTFNHTSNSIVEGEHERNLLKLIIHVFSFLSLCFYYDSSELPSILWSKKSIRLSGVGRTAHTFYRRIRTLFFSDSSKEEYQPLFLSGSRRRKRSHKRNPSPSGVKDTSGIVIIVAAATTSVGDIGSTAQCQDEIRVERATKPEEPAIYIIDNFLTQSELEYFDQKIHSIAFQRSFVDNMGSDDDNDKEAKSTIESENARHDKLENEKNQDEVAVPTKNQNGVCDGDASITKCLDSVDQQSQKDSTKNKKGEKKAKKRKRKTIVDDSHRTSTFYSFRKLHDTKISALEQRIANILGCWVHQIEALQLVRYLPGQFFGIHHDLGNLLEDDSVELPRKDLACKRRLVTIFCYLNTLGDEEGGCTYFPKCGDLRVKPQRGRAVLWCNITPDGKPDSRTIHAGEAVKALSSERTSQTSCAKKNSVANECSPGNSSSNELVQPKSKDGKKVQTTKYGLNIWVCEE